MSSASIPMSVSPVQAPVTDCIGVIRSVATRLQQQRQNTLSRITHSFLGIVNITAEEEEAVLALYTHKESFIDWIRSASTTADRAAIQCVALEILKTYQLGGPAFFSMVDMIHTLLTNRRIKDGASCLEYGLEKEKGQTQGATGTQVEEEAVSSFLEADEFVDVEVLKEEEKARPVDVVIADAIQNICDTSVRVQRLTTHMLTKLAFPFTGSGSLARRAICSLLTLCTYKDAFLGIICAGAIKPHRVVAIQSVAFEILKGCQVDHPYFFSLIDLIHASWIGVERQRTERERLKSELEAYVAKEHELSLQDGKPDSAFRGFLEVAGGSISREGLQEGTDADYVTLRFPQATPLPVDPQGPLKERLQQQFFQDSHRLYWCFDDEIKVDEPNFISSSWIVSELYTKLDPTDSETLQERLWVQCPDPRQYEKLLLFCNQTVGNAIINGEGNLCPKIMQSTLHAKISSLHPSSDDSPIHLKKYLTFHLSAEAHRVTCEVYFTLHVQDNPSSIMTCFSKVEWDSQEDRLTFLPFYGIKITDACSLIELNRLYQVLIGEN